MSALDFAPHARDYSAANAHALALLSQLAYSTKGVIKRKLKNWGFDEGTFQFLDANDTQGFVAAHDEYIVVAFRGTEALLADWLGNLKSHLTPGPLGKVHEGFAIGLNAVWYDVLQAIRDLNEDRTRPATLWITGHSLGGALATLATAKLIERGEPIDGLYTFGSPRCGDSSFVREFDANFSRYWRVVNHKDIVTRVPPRPFYHHAGMVQYLDENGVMRSEDIWEDFLRSFRNALEDLRNRQLSGINEHAIEAYIAALAALLRPAIVADR